MPATLDTARFRVTVYRNVDPGSFFGLQPRHEIATAPDLQLAISASTPQDAAVRAFAIGNRTAADDNGRRWPPDVRSVSFPGNRACCGWSCWALKALCGVNEIGCAVGVGSGVVTAPPLGPTRTA
jgi:hypothetical protein